MAGGAVIPALALAAGVFLIVLGLPRPRPRLAERLARLDEGAWRAMEAERARLLADAPLFRTPALERTVGVPLRFLAARLLGLLSRLRLIPATLAEDLERARPGATPAGFVAQKVLYALVLLGVCAAGAATGALGLPVYVWLVVAAAGWWLPDLQLRQALRQRRDRILGSLAPTVEVMHIATTSGLSPEQTFYDVARRVGGPLGEELRALAAEARMGRTTIPDGLAALARREGVQELAVLGDAWTAAQQAGAALGERLLELSRSLREQQRARILERAHAATVQMLFPVVAFIMPVTVIIVGYPAVLVFLEI